MDTSNTNEELEKRIKELYDEFWERVHALADRPSRKNVLDGGYSPENEVLAWYKEEVRKAREEYEEKRL